MTQIHPQVELHRKAWPRRDPRVYSPFMFHTKFKTHFKHHYVGFTTKSGECTIHSPSRTLARLWVLVASGEAHWLLLLLNVAAVKHAAGQCQAERESFQNKKHCCVEWLTALGYSTLSHIPLDGRR
jgi:hypothetical protein